jgi:phosphohistidine phosphatase SixA
MRRLIRRLAVVVSLLTSAAPVAAQGDESAAWAALAAGGHVALIRHAQTTPGAGDPPGWTLDDCATQRNLNEAGRREAAALGAALRARRIRIDAVLTSAWCRCRDTAALMDAGAATIEPSLANLFGNAPRAATQTAALRARVAAWRGPGTLVMISHGSTILSLTGINPLPAEIVVVAPGPGDAGNPRVVGRIRPPG